MTHKGLSLILVGALSLAVILSACAPSIPHSVQAQKECTTCHGTTGTKPYPAWHATRGYSNNDCSSCHDLKSENSPVAGATTR
jgi:hypothetical protein